MTNGFFKNKQICVKKIILIWIFVLFSPCLLADEIAFDKLPNNQIASFLGWTKTLPSAQNFCDGYFQEPKIVIDNPVASDIGKSVTNVVAKKQVFYAPQGDSVLEGEVTITHPGRQLIADKVILHRDSKTNKFISADLYGHVQLFEFGKLIIGNKGFIDFISNVVTVDNAVYRLAVPKTVANPESLNLWGRVRHLLRDESKVLTFFNSTYSTCQPDAEAWHISSSKLRLNKTTGVGMVNNAVLSIKKIPLLYFPYFEFPIDKRRKTGFLFPSPYYTDNSGMEIDLPFYLNLAPNYDAKITPRIMSKRGALFDGKFRYLTKNSTGKFDVQYIYNDREFAAFKNSALSNYPGDQALGRLFDSSVNRGIFAWQNISRINNHWGVNIDINYSGDDYFLHDFGILPSVVNEDQLLNQVMLNYASENWQFFGRVQAFQTLHLVDQTADDQYMRLPQLTLTGFFPNQKYGLNYQINTEYVYFDHRRVDFYDKNKIYPVGNRFNIAPSIELPINLGGAFFNPKFQLQGTFYGLKDVVGIPEISSADEKNMARITPIIGVDSGLLFKRSISPYFGKYTQTLEPRLFYVYVPRQNQDDIPIFDTNPSIVNFDNLFRTNRFNGIDRIGDTNQFSLALISRILNADSGEEKLRASIGEIVAVEKHKVCLDSLGNNNCDADPLAANTFSPLFGQLKYYLNPAWNVTADAAWDINVNKLNSINAGFGYNKDKHIFNIKYTYLVNGDNYNQQIVDLNRIDVSFALPVRQHWQVFGNWNHYFAHKEQTYIYGVAYNSCCWAIRFVGSHVYKGFDEFDKRFYLQFLLRGLGSIGNASPNSLLLNNISGFKDDFT